MNSYNETQGVVASMDKAFYQRYMKSMPNPNKLHTTFGSRKITFDIAKEDPHVASCIQSRVAGVGALEWDVQGETTEDNAAPDAIVADVKRMLGNLDIERIKADCVEAALYGFTAFELYWRPDNLNGRMINDVKAMIAKPQDWFTFDSGNNLRLMTTCNSDGEVLSNRKFITVQHKPSYTNPYGQALLSSCLWPIVYKKATISFWMKFNEKYGMPHFVGKTDAPGNDEDKKRVFESFRQALDDLQIDGSIVIDKMDGIEMMAISGTSWSDGYKSVIDFSNAEISKAILSQTLTTEVTQGGNYATGKVHAEVRQDIIDTDKMAIERAVNRLIKIYCEMNYADVKPPKFILFEKADVDMGLATVVDTLQKNKTLRFLEKFYVDRFGWKKDEFEILDPNAAPAPMFSLQPSITTHAEPTEKTYADQLIVDAFGDEALRRGGEEFYEASKIVTSFMAKKTSYEDALKGIAGLVDEMDPAKLQKKLTSLLFVADVTGRLAVTKETSDGR